METLDVEGLLVFAEHVIGNAASSWRETVGDQRQRLQRALFPDGLRLRRDRRFGTAVTCLAFMQLQQNPEDRSGLASRAPHPFTVAGSVLLRVA